MPTRRDSRSGELLQRCAADEVALGLGERDGEVDARLATFEVSWISWP
jgi:hypothetical protein